MAFCIHCGAEVASEATFCHSCGGAIGAGEPTTPQPEAPPADWSAAETNEVPAQSSWAPSGDASWSSSPEPAAGGWTPEPEASPSSWAPVDSGAGSALGGSSWSGVTPEPTPGAWSGSTPEATPGGWSGGTPAQTPGAWSGGTPAAPEGSWSADPTPAASSGWPPSLSAGPSSTPPPPSFSPPPSTPVKVPNYLVPSIFSMLCCCLPAGVVSLIFSIQANSKADAGLYEEAMRNANLARIWLWVSVGVGVLGSAGAFLVQLLAALAQS